MTKNKIISLLLTLVMLFSLGVSASAADYEPGVYDGELIIEEGVPITESNPGFDVSQIRELPVQTNAAISTEESERIDTSEKSFPAAASRPEISLDEADATLPARNDRLRGNGDYYGGTYTGSIPTADGWWYLTATLGNNELLQVKLNVPTSLNVDYDLELYPLNSDGTVNWNNMLDISCYGTDSNYFAERVGVVNQTGAAVTYVVGVFPYKGYGSQYTFSVDAMITENGAFDDEEADESVFSAYELAAITPTANGTIQIQRSISSPLDNDWFEIPVQDTSLTELNIYGLPSNLVAEIYTVKTGYLMEKRGSTDTGTTLPVTQGYNYLRIAPKANVAFNYTDYAVTIGRPEVQKASKYFTYIAVGGYCQRYSTEFTDKKARGLYTTGTACEAKVVYLDSNNAPVNVNDTVMFYIRNPQWPESNEYQNPRNTVSITNKSQCIVPLTTGSTAASTGYDEVYTYVLSDTYGMLVNGENMALVRKYNGGETSKACRHPNKECGYK